VQLGNLLTKCETISSPQTDELFISLKQASEYCVTIAPTFQLSFINTGESDSTVTVTIQSAVHLLDSAPSSLPDVVVTVTIPADFNGYKVPLSAVWVRDLPYGDYTVSSVVAIPSAQSLSHTVSGELSVVASVTRF
jgi:hypothetical protein